MIHAIYPRVLLLLLLPFHLCPSLFAALCMAQDVRLSASTRLAYMAGYGCKPKRGSI
ncbi:hypothetical protein LY76DRAFT_588589 [Colletotrichum caudatum]|nr:hypothetical protein LY76DRAFT_588589 [Colletotrichum caudatum]